MSAETFFILFLAILALIFLIVMCVSISFARKRDKLILKFLAVIVKNSNTSKDFIDCTKYISETENIIDVMQNNSSFAIIKNVLQDKIRNFYEKNPSEKPINDNKINEEKDNEPIVL